MGDSKYNKYIQSEEWAQVKLDLIQIRGCACQRCGRERTLKSIHVHHLTYERLFNELPQDLVLLCARCHILQHKDKVPEKLFWKSYSKDKKFEKGEKYSKLPTYTIAAKGKRDRIPFAQLVNKVKDKIYQSGYKGVKERRLKNGYQFKFDCETIVNIFETTTIVIQGDSVNEIKVIIESSLQ